MGYSSWVLDQAHVDQVLLWFAGMPLENYDIFHTHHITDVYGVLEELFEHDRHRAVCSFVLQNPIIRPNLIVIPCYRMSEGVLEIERPLGGFHHITVATNGNTKPVESNEVLRVSRTNVIKFDKVLDMDSSNYRWSR